MKKLVIFSLAAIVAACTFVACNDSDYVAEDNASSNVAVYSFSLSQDDSVLVNLDSVFFSIDLEKARIFNADSMPYGTKINKLVPVVTINDIVSRAEITVKRADGTDTVFDYIKSPNDTIDFSHGPAKLTVCSQNGIVVRDYTIDINVHQVKPDSLTWSTHERTTLPSDLAQPTAQHASLDGTTLYSISYAGSSWAMAVQHDAPEGTWNTYNISVPAAADIATFTAAGGKLYICAGGKLYTSTNGGRNWTDTGRNWTYIYGAYGDKVVGVAGDVTELFPGNASPAEIPQDMPVKDCSQTVNFTFDMSTSAQMLFVGGTTRKGVISADTWAFDGNSWIKLSNGKLPVALRDATLVPFFAFAVDNVFAVTEYTILMAFGGSTGSANNKTVYISDDFGITWTTGGELIQLPSYIPAMRSAQAFVFDITRTPESRSSIWTSFAAPILPTGYTPEIPLSRATSPIESWQTPYIYLYGGITPQNVYSKTIWRGTINRLKFKPIQ